MSIPAPAALARHQVTWPIGWAGSTPGPLAGASGHIAFEASATVIAYSDATVLPEPVITPVIGGVMVPVDLIENDVDVWNWRVTPRLGVAWEPFHINVDGPVNIASAATTPGKGPVRVVKGDRGAQGASLASLEQITATKLRSVIDDPLTGEQVTSDYVLPPGPANVLGIGNVTTGPTAAAYIKGDSPSQSLDLVVPRGEQGLPGVNAVPADEAVAAYIASTSQTSEALESRYRRGVSSRELGAVGDGVADDTAALQATINLATSMGMPVTVPAGRYRVTSTINLPAGASVRLDPSATLDIADLPAISPALQAAGTALAPIDVTETATRGSRTVTVADTTGFTVGDWVKIASTLPFGSTSQPIGEIQRITSLTSTTLTVDDTLCDDYTVEDSATVARIVPCEGVSITGGRMEGSPSDPTILHRGIMLDRCADVRVSGMSFRWVHHIGVWLLDTISATVTDCRFDEALGAGFGYGIGASWASQDISVTACAGTRLRHLVTFGGGTARAGVVRRVTVTGCTASQCFDAALDAHPAAEDYIFTGNAISATVSDGIVAQGGRCVITGNTISGSGRHGILAQNFTRRGLELVIANNTIHGSKGAGISIPVVATSEYRMWSGVSITGNVIADTTSYGIAVENVDASFSATGVAATGNVIRRCGRHGVYLRGVREAAVGSNQVTDVLSTQESIYLHTCTDATVTGNVINGGMRAIRVLASPGSVVSANRAAGATVGLLTDATSAPVVAMGNNFSGSTTGKIIGGTGNITASSDASGSYNL